MRKRNEKIAVISVPLGKGAGAAGAELGAKSMLEEGNLPAKLEQLGVQYELSEVPYSYLIGTETAAEDTKGMKHLAEVLDVNVRLADEVRRAVDGGRMPLVLGGDHSIAIGTIAGLAEEGGKLGVIWIDAHSDLNTPETSPSGNIHGMSLAASLGVGDSRLTSIRGIIPKLDPKHVAIVGARSLDAGEKAFIRSLGIACYTMHDIDKLGIAKVMSKVIKGMKAAGCRVHLSFDIDSLDPREAPGTGTPVRGGLGYREAHLALELLYQSGIIASAEFVEVNPLLDTDYRTAKLAVELIGSLLGEQIL